MMDSHQRNANATIGRPPSVTRPELTGPEFTGLTAHEFGAGAVGPR